MHELNNEISSSFCSNLSVDFTWKLKSCTSPWHSYLANTKWFSYKWFKEINTLSVLFYYFGVGPVYALSLFQEVKGLQGLGASKKSGLYPLKKACSPVAHGTLFRSQFMKLPEQSDKSRPLGRITGLYWFSLMLFSFSQTYWVLVEKNFYSTKPWQT